MIEIKNVRKEWKIKDIFVRAIDNVSLSIKEGEFISIIGPSGCGKTTLIRIIAGLLKPTSGAVSLCRAKTSSASNLGIVFQNPTLLPWRTVYGNVKLPAELNNLETYDNVDEWIKLVGLDKFQNAYPNELSGGMQQRVAIARALV